MNKNKSRRNLILQGVLITFLLTLLFFLYLAEHLSALPLPSELYHKGNNSEAYLSLLYKLRIFQDEIKEKNIGKIQLTREEIQAYIYHDKEFVRKYSIESFFIEDGNIEVIINNKIKGKTYELWFTFKPEVKKGKIILLVSQAKIGKLSLPTFLAQHIVNKLVDSVKSDLYFVKIWVNGGKISIIAKKE